MSNAFSDIGFFIIGVLSNVHLGVVASMDLKRILREKRRNVNAEQLNYTRTASRHVETLVIDVEMIEIHVQRDH